ncbi:MAG: hypothetical protein N2378_17190 [Chloroflexaceae bacterium]|nr:hypothetical protein [Chloroflexaceae bacterium]
MQRCVGRFVIALAILVLIVCGGLARFAGVPVHAAPQGYLSVLYGAAIDDRTGELVIFGRNDPFLPPLDITDLTVALRTRFDMAANPIDHWPGVTIEFSSTNQSVLDVTYFGPIRNTRFGYVLFESDRLLKYYGLGYDNSNGVAEPVRSNVPGYQSELACMAERGYVPPAGQVIQWRKWFSPTLTVQAATDGSAMVFTQSRITLNWAYNSQATDPAVSACVQRFVDHFNQNYQRFADEQQTRGNPVLHELVQYGRLMAIAEWLFDRNLSRRVPGLNAAWLNCLPVTAHTTPLTTPRISVPAGNLIQSGGVDLRVVPGSYLDVPQTPGLAAAVLSSRDRLDAREWEAVVEESYCPAAQTGPRPSQPSACRITATALSFGDPAEYGFEVIRREGNRVSINPDGPLGEPYIVADGDATLRYTFSGTELANPPIALHYLVARSVQQGRSARDASDNTAYQPAAAVNQVTVRLLPANGQPVLVHTFTGEGREGLWIPGPYLDLSPYAGQQLTIEVEISIVPGSGVLFAFGGLQVTTAQPLPQQPSPTETPTPIPQSYRVYLPMVVK